MRLLKITTLLFIFSTFVLNAQITSTGEIVLNSNLDINTTLEFDIDNDDSKVTITLTGPENRWFGVGFNTTFMEDGTDVIYVSNGELFDAYLTGQGNPSIDGDNNLTLISNSIDDGKRTVIIERPLNTGDANDYIFPSEVSEDFNVIYANGVSATSSSLGYHGGNRGFVAVGMLLDVNGVFASQFSISPNPTENEVAFSFPDDIRSGKIAVSDYTGKIVMTSSITSLQKSLNVSTLETGVYLVTFDTPKGIITKKLVKV